MLSILVPALALLVVLIPALALQLLLRLVGPPPARRSPDMRRRKERVTPIQDSPRRTLGLSRVAS